MKTVAIVQARMGSTRLPGKVLKEVGGRPLLAYVVERLKYATKLDEVVVATSRAPQDDAIAAWCEGQTPPISCFRGDEHDVLKRYADCAAAHNAETVVRVTADCPLIDPAVVDKVVTAFEAAEVDYASNTHVASYPIGLAVEVFTGQGLAEANNEADNPHHREHVTPFFYTNPERFTLHDVVRTPSVAHHRWTVDTPEDFELVEKMLSALHLHDPKFTVDDGVKLLREHPDWVAINQDIRQKRYDE